MKKHLNALKIKKLYVYAALLVEEHLKMINLGKTLYYKYTLYVEAALF